jgi:hypothetical protein
MNPRTALLILLACLPHITLAEAPWRMKLTDEPWKLTGFANDLDLSGIASADGRHCLVGSDESFSIQPGRIDPATRHIEALPAVPLLPPHLLTAKTEVDIEGVAWSAADSCYYVTGSHGLGKKKGEVQESRSRVFRIPFDAATGTIQPAAIRFATLRGVLEGFPETKPFLLKPLQQNGLNIEGLTVSGNRLYFGLRAPNVENLGYVVEVDPASLFDGEGAAPRLHPVELGPQRGIREIATLAKGFLILTGNASAETSKQFPETLAPGPDKHFELLYWNPADDPQTSHIGSIPAAGKGKAEALLIQNESPERIDLLVLFDSLPGGGPLALRLEAKPPSP